MRGQFWMIGKRRYKYSTINTDTYTLNERMGGERNGSEEDGEGIMGEKMGRRGG